MKSAESMYNEIQPLLENNWDEAAMSAYERLLQVHPTYAPAHFDLGMLRLKFQQNDAALAHLEQSASLEPESVAYSKVLADFYYAKNGNADKALQIYQRLVRIDPKNAEIHFITGNLAVALHRFDLAVDCYENVLEIDPMHANATVYLDKLRLHLQQQSEPTASPEELHEKAQEQANAGNPSRAIMLLEHLVKHHPDFALGHNDLGVVNSQAGAADKALFHYEQAYRLEPDNPTIQKNLAECYFLQGDHYQQALQIGLEILKRDPEDTETLMMAGHINFALDRMEDAKLFYARVLDIEPWHFDASECLAKVENQDGAIVVTNFH